MPAEKAGIEAGDIITKVQGKSVERYSDLPRLVGMVKPGDKVALQVFHDGKYKEVTADVIDFGPETPPTLADATPDPVASSKATLGMKVIDLGDAERARLHVKGGVRVDSVEGAAARAGVQDGDIVLSIGNVPVTSVKQFIATVAKLDKTKSIAMLVRRGDSANYVVIRPSK
jgi:serine protease Do